MERKKDGKSFLGVNVKTKLCHQGSWCSFLLWDDFNLVLEEYVSGVMAFREYVTCGYQAWPFYQLPVADVTMVQGKAAKQILPAANGRCYALLEPYQR